MIMVQQGQTVPDPNEFDLETGRTNENDYDKTGDLPQLVRLGQGRGPGYNHMLRTMRKTSPQFDNGILCEHDKIVNMLNPEPLPYQVQRFKPCTAFKVVDIPRRHVETFGQNATDPIQKSKAIVLHTERFSWDARPQDLVSQRDRLTNEQEHVEIARVMKRRGDVLAHRERHDLLLGGEKVPIQDRDMSSRDINAVLSERLDSLVPQPMDISQNLSADPRPPEVHVFRRPEGSQQQPGTGVPEGGDTTPWEPERHTFENQVNTVSMGVQRAVLHQRSRLSDYPSPSAPPQLPKRQSQIPRLPRLHPHTTASTETDPGLMAPPRPPLKRRGLSEMIMGGARAPLNERADIQSELRRLKSVPLPQTARELFIGRGIRLPPNHATIKPRRPPPTSELVQVSSFPQADSPPNHGVHITTSSGAKVHISSSPNNDIPVTNNKNDVEVQEREEDNGVALDPVNETTAEVEPSSPPPPEQPVEPPPELRPQSTPTDRPTPNPLKGALFKSVHPDVDKDDLLKTFRRLDTDMDGHVTFNQLESEIPDEFTNVEKRFVREVYNIVSASTFFGSEEFALLKLFCHKIKDLDSEARGCFEKIKDIDLNEGLVKFVEMYQTVDRNNNGEISYDSLKEILATLLEKDLEKDADYLDDVLKKCNFESGQMIEKLDYLCYIPYFMSLEPNLHTQFASQRAKTILEG